MLRPRTSSWPSAATRPSRRFRASTRSRPWTNRQATSAREAAAQPGRAGRRPDRHRAGPGLRALRRAGHDRRIRTIDLNDRDHPNNSAAIRGGLERDGVDCSCTSVRAEEVVPAGARRDHEITVGRLGVRGPAHPAVRRAARCRSTASASRTLGVTRSRTASYRRRQPPAGRRRVGRRRSGRARDAHPPRALRGRDGRCGWHWATTSSPTTEPSRAASTRTPRPAAWA